MFFYTIVTILVVIMIVIGIKMSLHLITIRLAFYKPKLNKTLALEVCSAMKIKYKNLESKKILFVVKIFSKGLSAELYKTCTGKYKIELSKLLID
ncbi:hypothetical protein P8V03_18825 [Clostridium sp. A1-XYC3]|uniref:Uncharacterized protein n=1 Tax=Clostridium tanneri TaxID=3037988 RepID=A0ABU4JYD0_9CLOT|nr:hypothetical protein [Clostridium sp. A1-XYC3]MDW8803185.1 hypothetical protein [Clostridium sp. A1-XYC3]